jgi:hypothetical protein
MLELLLKQVLDIPVRCALSECLGNYFRYKIVCQSCTRYGCHTEYRVKGRSKKTGRINCSLCMPEQTERNTLARKPPDGKPHASKKELELLAENSHENAQRKSPLNHASLWLFAGQPVSVFTDLTPRFYASGCPGSWPRQSPGNWSPS